MLANLHLYLECPVCKRRMRHYVKGLSCRQFRLCPRCGAKVEPSVDTLVRALLKLEHAERGDRFGL